MNKITAFYFPGFFDITPYYETDDAFNKEVSNAIIEYANKVDAEGGDKEPVTLLIDKECALRFAMCGGAALSGAVHFAIEEAVRNSNFAARGVKADHLLKEADHVMFFGLREEKHAEALAFMAHRYPGTTVVDHCIDRPRKTLR